MSPLTSLGRCTGLSWSLLGLARAPRRVAASSVLFSRLKLLSPRPPVCQQMQKPTEYHLMNGRYPDSDKLRFRAVEPSNPSAQPWIRCSRVCCSEPLANIWQHLPVARHPSKPETARYMHASACYSLHGGAHCICTSHQDLFCKHARARVLPRRIISLVQVAVLVRSFNDRCCTSFRVMQHPVAQDATNMHCSNSHAVTGGVLTGNQIAYAPHRIALSTLVTY